MKKQLGIYGILTEIKYPTGGKTVFDFEPHDFSNSIKDIIYKKTTLAGFYSLRLQAPSYCYVTQKFDIKENTLADMEVRFHPREPDPGYPYPSIYVYIYKQEPSGQYSNFKYYLFETDESSYFNNTGSNIYTDNFQLPAGKYYFDIRNNHQGYNESTVSVGLSGITKSEEVSGGGRGGGLRIKSITSYADNDKSTKKTFNYTTASGTTSGTLITPPQHLSQYALMETKITILPTAVFADTYQSLYLNGYSTPYTPFSRSAQGGLVGYSHVEEKIVDSANESNVIGITSYRFINKQDDSSNLRDRLIKGFPAISHNDNGTPLEACHFDKDMKLKKMKIFEYSSKEKTHNIKGLRVFQLPMVDKGDATVKYYDVPAERWHLIRTREYEYDENSLEPVATTWEYGYHPVNLLVNYEKTTDSKNNSIEKQINYPIDFTSSIHIEMKNNHLVNIPVEIIESVVIGINKTETSRTRIEYFRDAIKTKNLIVPGKIETSYSGVSELCADIIFERYDQKGNTVHSITKDGMNIVHLWGYNRQYPIAEIRNATYAQLMSFINETTLNSILTKTEPSGSDMVLIDGLRSKLPKSLITTYTYKPLTGIIRKTGPDGATAHYEYDSFGRLKQVKDSNGKVIEEYDYHYKP